MITMQLNNLDVRRKMYENHVTQKALAAQIGCNPVTVCRWFAEEMPEHKKAELFKIIEEIKK